MWVDLAYLFGVLLVVVWILLVGYLLCSGLVLLVCVNVVVCCLMFVCLIDCLMVDCNSRYLRRLCFGFAIRLNLD